MLFMPEMGMITMVTNFGLNSPAGAEVVFGVAEAGLANGVQAVGLQLGEPLGNSQSQPRAAVFTRR